MHKNISIIVPIYNEESSINQLYDEIIDSLKDITEIYEIIFVDDGSTDKSISNINNLVSKDNNVILVQLNNFSLICDNLNDLGLN